jgi:hypothetical protein
MAYLCEACDQIEENVHICSMWIKIGKQEVEIWWFQKRFPRYGIPMWSMWPNIRFLPSIVAEKNVTKNILEGRTDRGKTVYPSPPSGSGGIIRSKIGSKCVDLILIRLAKWWNNFFSSKCCIWLYCENGKYMIILWKCQVGIYFFSPVQPNFFLQDAESK